VRKINPHRAQSFRAQPAWANATTAANPPLHTTKKPTHAKPRSSARQRYLENLRVFIATPGPK